MRKLILNIVIIATALLGRADQPSVGLVLSGGGAKGIAHIGVIQALEENDIAIDCITGTSMGAIVGGLYAAGYSPDEMMELLGSSMFTNASTGTIDPELRSYITSPAPSPKLFSFSLGSDSVASKVPWSLISPTVMNFAFMEVFAPATRACQGDFNQLFVPLRTVSSNIAAQRPEISRSGPLDDAIRASMSFPLIFCPIMINDTLHYDGGIFENFPVKTMRAECNPDFIIGVDVHTPDSLSPKPTAINQLNNLVTREQTYDLPEEEGVKIHIDLHEFSLLDFNKAAEIYAIGYRRGLEMIDSIKSRTSARRTTHEVANRRNEFMEKIIGLRFSQVECTGGTPAQNEYIKAQFPKGNFSLQGARNGFYRAISSGCLQDLQIHAESIDDEEITYRMQLKAFPKPAWSVGIGGYVSSSTTSMLFASVGYNPFMSKSISARLDTWIGQTYLASQIMATIRLGATNPYTLAVQGVVSKHSYTQTEKMFYRFNEPKFVTTSQAYVRAYPVQIACGRHAAASLSIGYGYQRFQFTSDNAVRKSNSLKLGQVALRYDYNTLDAVNYPTSGLEIHASAMALFGHRYGLNKSRTKWLQAEVNARKYWNLHSHFAIGIDADLLVSSRKAPGNIDAALAEAPAYSPTPSTYNSFNPSFRAYSFLGAGVTPIYKITQQLQLRGTFHIFVPWQRIPKQNDSPNHPGKPEFFGEIQAMVNLKFANLCAYGNYRTGSKPDRGWNVGLSLGIFVLAPDFLK